MELHGTPDAEDVRGILEFVARTDSIRVMPRGGDSAALGDSPDGAYGFFGDLISHKVQQAHVLSQPR